MVFLLLYYVIIYYYIIWCFYYRTCIYYPVCDIRRVLYRINTPLAVLIDPKSLSLSMLSITFHLVPHLMLLSHVSHTPKKCHRIYYCIICYYISFLLIMCCYILSRVTYTCYMITL